MSFKFGEIISLILSLSTRVFLFLLAGGHALNERNTLLTFVCLHNKINNGQMDFASGTLCRWKDPQVLKFSSLFPNQFVAALRNNTQQPYNIFGQGPPT